MSGIPVVLQFKHRSSVVIGGGKVALKRTAAIVEAGGSVHLIAENVSGDWSEWIEHHLVTIERRTVVITECFISDYLFLCTDDAKLHDALTRNSAPRQLLYRSDNGDQSDVHFPATIKKGLLTLALSTSGASPTYTKQLREKIDDYLPDSIEEDLHFLKQARDRIQSSQINHTKKVQLLHDVASVEVLQRDDRDAWLLRRLSAQE